MGDPFAAAMRSTRMPMLITDPNKPDNPVVFANDAFLHLTGYERGEIIGRNCRFLQGSGTDPADVAAIRDAIEARKDISIDILNYRKDGTTFWNALYMSPVSDESGETLYFFASQLDVTDRRRQQEYLANQKEEFERAVKDRTLKLEQALEAQTMLLHEVDHRVKNNLQLVSSLILMQTRQMDDPAIRESLRAMQERIEALGTVHHLLYHADDVRQLSAADLVREITLGLVASSGRKDISTNLELDDLVVHAEQATPIALIVNELVTNALKHAFPDDRGGQISVRVRGRGNGLLLEVADDGIGIAGRPRGSASEPSSWMCWRGNCILVSNGSLPSLGRSRMSPSIHRHRSRQCPQDGR